MTPNSQHGERQGPRLGVPFSGQHEGQHHGHGQVSMSTSHGKHVGFLKWLGRRSAYRSDP